MSRYPREYASTDYARVDYRLAGRSMALTLRAVSACRPALLAASSMLFKVPYLPVAVGRPLLRLLSGSRYFDGTRDREIARDSR